MEKRCGISLKHAHKRSSDCFGPAALFWTVAQIMGLDVDLYPVDVLRSPQLVLLKLIYNVDSREFACVQQALSNGQIDELAECLCQLMLPRENGTLVSRAWILLSVSAEQTKHGSPFPVIGLYRICSSRQSIDMPNCFPAFTVILVIQFQHQSQEKGVISAFKSGT